MIWIMGSFPPRRTGIRQDDKLGVISFVCLFQITKSLP